MDQSYYGLCITPGRKYHQPNESRGGLHITMAGFSPTNGKHGKKALEQIVKKSLGDKVDWKPSEFAIEKRKGKWTLVLNECDSKTLSKICHVIQKHGFKHVKKPTFRITLPSAKTKQEAKKIAKQLMKEDKWFLTMVKSSPVGPNLFKYEWKKYEKLGAAHPAVKKIAKQQPAKQKKAAPEQPKAPAAQKVLPLQNDNAPKITVKEIKTEKELASLIKAGKEWAETAAKIKDKFKKDHEKRQVAYDCEGMAEQLPDELENILKSGKSVFVAQDENKEIQGIAIADLPSNKKKVNMLDFICVNPRSIKLIGDKPIGGVGTAIVKEIATRILNDKNARQVLVTQAIESSEPFYKKLGFIDGDIEGMYNIELPPYHDVVDMALKSDGIKNLCAKAA